MQINLKVNDEERLLISFINKKHITLRMSLISVKISLAFEYAVLYLFLDRKS